MRAPRPTCRPSLERLECRDLPSATVLKVHAESPTVTAGTTATVLLATLTTNNAQETAKSFHATVDWGDGTSSTAAVAAVKGKPHTFTVSGKHAFGLGTTELSADVHATDPHDKGKPKADLAEQIRITGAYFRPIAYKVTAEEGKPLKNAVVGMFETTAKAPAFTSFKAVLQWNDARGDQLHRVAAKVVHDSRSAGRFDVIASPTFDQDNRDLGLSIELTAAPGNVHVYLGSHALVNEVAHLTLVDPVQPVYVPYASEGKLDVVRFTEPDAKVESYHARATWTDAAGKKVAELQDGSDVSFTTAEVHGETVVTLAVPGNGEDDGRFETNQALDPGKYTLTLRIDNTPTEGPVPPPDRTVLGFTKAGNADLIVKLSYTVQGPTLEMATGMPGLAAGQRYEPDTERLRDYADITLGSFSPLEFSDLKITVKWGDGQSTTKPTVDPRYSSPLSKSYALLHDHAYPKTGVPGTSHPWTITVVVKIVNKQLGANLTLSGHVKMYTDNDT